MHAGVINDGTCAAPAPQPSLVRLTVLLTNADGPTLSCRYLDEAYEVDRAEVIAVEAPSRGIPYEVGDGRPADILLNPAAALIKVKSVRASHLADALPFTLATRTLVKPLVRDPADAAHDTRWLVARGIDPATATALGTCNTPSNTVDSNGHVTFPDNFTDAD
jgi:hypothetical protein